MGQMIESSVIDRGTQQHHRPNASPRVLSGNHSVISVGADTPARPMPVPSRKRPIIMVAILSPPRISTSPPIDHADGRKRDRLLQPQLAADEGGGEGKHDADKRYHRHQHAEAACIEAETAVGTDPRHIDEIKRNRDDLELRHGRSKAYQERDDPNHPRVAGRFLFLDS